jgi:anthranilate/para-aminobenzoate synthase component II
MPAVYGGRVVRVIGIAHGHVKAHHLGGGVGHQFFAELQAQLSQVRFACAFVGHQNQIR